MIHRLHSIQPMPPKGHGRLVNGQASGVKFGVLTPKQLSTYQEVLSDIPSVQKFSPKNLHAIHANLSLRQKEQLEQICDYVDPELLAKMGHGGKLGVLKPAADMLLGLYVLTALRSGAISEEAIKKLSLHAEKDKVEFDQVLKEVSDTLPQNKVDRFQQLVGGSPDTAKELLSVIVVRAALTYKRDKHYTLHNDGKKILSQGLEAFNAMLPWYSPRRMQAWLMVAAYKYIPMLPVEWFRSKLLGVIQERLELGVRYDDLMNAMNQNELYNQSIQYRNPKSNKLRKYQAVLSLQMLYEAAIIKHAALWHPDGKTFKLQG